MIIALLLKKKILYLINLGIILLVFNTCDQCELLSPNNEYKNIDRLYEQEGRMHLTPTDIADAHGAILKNFFDTLFNDELIIDKHSKMQLLINNELPLDLIERVYINVVNNYLFNKGYDERIGNYEYRIIHSIVIDNPRRLGIFDPLSIHEANTINAASYIKYLEYKGIINPLCSNKCVDFIDNIEKNTEGHTRSDIKHELALLVSASENEDYIEAIFKEVYSNSANTWCVLENSDWIDDPELKEWWDWFMSTPKGQAIGLIVCDAMGGILSAIIAYYSCGTLAQIVIPIASAALASIGFALWAM